MLDKVKRVFIDSVGLARRDEVPYLGICESCEKPKMLHFVHPMTMYERKNDESDPNYVGFLCEECKNNYISYWTERWSDYYNSVL